MYKIKRAVIRSVALMMSLAFLSGIVSTTLLRSIATADALNPLTKRQLLLTSSSPGWAYTDGAGDPTYAPPGSGANGQKTGETFTFDASTDSTITGVPVKAFTFQYCTTAAGLCTSPGNDPTSGGGAGVDSVANQTSDLNVVVSSPVEGTNFEVYTYTGGSWHAGSGWTMTVGNAEDGPSPTGKDNLITLVKSAGISPTAGEPIKVVFDATSSNYITNPGSGAFFVKINDYTSTTYQNWADNDPNTPVSSGGGSPTYTCGTDSGLADDDCPQNTIDGGVTVANVMNLSIEIQTKVLETMDFSVGTVDPDTLDQTHGQCDPVVGWNSSSPTAENPSNDVLMLGNPSAEFSLSPTEAYGTSSLFRLSSNSANGATVYYTGNTLADTEDNQIAPMGDSPTSDDSAYAHPGTEQFGLGLNYSTGTDPLTGATDSLMTPYGAAGLDSGFTSDVTSNQSNPYEAQYWYTPTLSPLAPEPSYGDAVGAEDGQFSSGNETGSAGPKFAFNASANTVPVPIASEDTTVVTCSTGQVNYLADIAPSTPAGIYTTKINYLASPEY